MTDNFHTHEEQQEREMAVTGTGKREFQIMSVSFVANVDTGGVTPTEKPNQLDKKERGTVLFKCVDGFKYAFLLSKVCPSNLTSRN